MNQRIWLSSEFSVRVCNECGISHAVPQKYINSRRDDHKVFYCPNRHGNHFPQMSDEEKLKEQLSHCQIDRDFWKDVHDVEENRRKSVERSRSALRGVITKMKKRGE